MSRGGRRESPGSDAETARVRRIYDKLAPRYDADIAFFEQILFGDGRRWVCARARGDVLEIAIGTGRNLPFYPGDVRLTGVELSAPMLMIARARARRLRRRVDLCGGDAQALPFAAQAFDTVVATLAFCTIPDPRRALREARRVLRPGGQLLLLEHVRSRHLLVRAGQRGLEPLLVRWQGDHLLRDPLDDLPAAGFQIVRLVRTRWGIVERLAGRIR